MTNILIIVLFVLIIAALFLLESYVGFIGLIKSLVIILIGGASLAGMIFYMSGYPAIQCETTPETKLLKSDTLWGGIGIASLCQVNDPNNDDNFLRIATDRDIDVQAYKKGNEAVYGDLTQDHLSDAKLARRSQIHSDNSKKASVNRSRFTADSVRKYFEDELDANENRTWWDNDELDAYT
jgi:hypothetical protein